MEEIDIDRVLEEADKEVVEEPQAETEEAVEEQSGQDAEEGSEGTEQPEVKEDETASGSMPKKITVEPDAIIELDGEELTAEQLKKLREDYLNDTKWKQKNEERGRRLNQAEELMKRLESDNDFKSWIERYQDSRERELLEVYDEDTAKAIRKMEQENLQLKQQVIVREAEEMYLGEEKELLTTGADAEDISAAYEILSANNAEYYRVYGRPMPLKEAFAKYLVNGGQQKILERERLKLEEKIKKERTSVMKSSVPRDLGSSASVAEKALPSSEDPLKHPVFDLDIFKDVRDK